MEQGAWRRTAFSHTCRQTVRRPVLSIDNAAKHRQRLAGAILAIAVQAGLLALLVISRPVIAPPEKLAKELTLFLPRLPPAPAPPVSLSAPAKQAAPRLTAPRPIVPAPPPLGALRAAPAAPDLSQLGRSLFGCAIETWSSLTPEQRAKCPRPGEGLTVRSAPDLLHPPPSRSKDEAYWQEQWAEDHWSPPACPGGASVVDCLLQQKHEEQKRREDVNDRLAAKKAAGLAEPKHPLPENIGVHPP